MEKLEKPLIVEYHDGFEDIFVWKGLPGGFSRVDLYFVSVLSLVVFIYQFIQGQNSLQDYINSFFFLILLSAFYKGIKVGLDSINYKKYEDGKITRLAESFIIWGKDNPIGISDSMSVAIRPVAGTTSGVVYLYEGNERHIAFMADNDRFLEQFAQIVKQKYDLQQLENVYE